VATVPPAPPPPEKITTTQHAPRNLAAAQREPLLRVAAITAIVLAGCVFLVQLGARLREAVK
jgi:hypothetical protein